MDERYPIGTFHWEGEISPAQREQRIREIEQLPSRVRDAIQGLSQEQLDTPYREGGWSIRQVVHHIADSHMNSYIRFKLALTEDTPTIKPYREERWAQLEDSIQADVQLSLLLIEALHKRWVLLLKSMSESDYRRSFHHPESNQMVQLDYALGLYVWHGNHHTAHITNCRKKFKQRLT